MSGPLGKDLLGLSPLSADQIRLVLDTAVPFREISERQIKKVPTLRGMTIVNLFFEASTRTRISFEFAEKRLSADTVNVAVAGSSVAKGETLVDTARNLEAMKIDMVVIRHPSSGAAQFLSERIESNVINAGDGTNEHPTQGLPRLAHAARSLRRPRRQAYLHRRRDVLHSRVARSNIWGSLLGAEVAVCGPRSCCRTPSARWATGVRSRRGRHQWADASTCCACSWNACRRATFPRCVNTTGCSATRASLNARARSLHPASGTDEPGRRDRQAMSPTDRTR
jgi:aspartate carbamoyltransferase catalytic subunit